MVYFDTIFNKETNTWYGPQPAVPLYHPNISIGAVLLNSLQRNPNHIGQISEYNDLKLTNQEIRYRTIRTIYKLEEFGIKMDDMVGIISRNSHNLAPIVLACLTMGAPINTLDPTFTNEDIVHMFAITRPKMVFCDEENFTVVQKACKDIHIKPIFIVTLGRIEGYPAVDDFFTPTGTENSYVPPILSDGTKQPAVIICSSGTTGRSKGVCLSHAALLYHCCQIPLHVHDILLCFSSLYWLSGMMILIGGTLVSATRIITTKPFNPDLMLGLIEKYQVTYVMTPPAQLAVILNSSAIKTTDLSSLKFYLCGGSAVNPSLINKFYNQLPKTSDCNLIVGYGMSECAGIITLNDRQPKIGSVGKLFCSGAVRIIDPNGNRCSIGERGEIWIKSVYDFLGYWSNEEETRQAIDSSGWLRSGDIGYFDEDGYLFITSRLKEILKYSNYQISPSEIEDVISRHPDVESVCVIGISDIVTDLPAAAVKPRRGTTIRAEDIKKLVEENLADYKRLRGGVYFVDEMPMTPSGKIIRKKVQKYANDLYQTKMIQ